MKFALLFSIVYRVYRVTGLQGSGLKGFRFNMC